MSVIKYWVQNIRENFRSYFGTIPHIFLHYIGECIGVISCSHEEIEQLITFTNIFYPTSISPGPFWAPNPFRDVVISISGDQLTKDISYNRSDLRRYCTYFYPASCTNVIPYSQLLYLRPTCSSEDQLHHRQNPVSLLLHRLQVTPHMFDNAVQHISSTSCTSDIQPQCSQRNKDRTLHLPPHQLLHTSNHTLPFMPPTNGPHNLEYSSLPTLIRGHSLRNFLVRLTPSTSPHPTPDTFLGHRKTCKICTYTSYPISIHSHKGSLRIRQKFICTSANVTYSILYNQFGLLYIGDTGRQLAYHFRLHLWDTRSIRHHRPMLSTSSPPPTPSTTCRTWPLHPQTRTSRNLEEDASYSAVGHCN
ncbi:uncharacterized protein [Chiloscyllium punctatum]|uniref:uncharacterized protein n=1 Tax=Chiloscyllium punctatum TaxID=137246 RepID=UPI003B636EE0